MPDDGRRDLVVVGGGPGGYAAAFYAADLGMRVTLVDPEAHPGGVCLYRGCIPSKALLHAVKILRDAEEASGIGIRFGPPEIDPDALRGWKDGVVRKLTGGLGGLVKQRGIEYIQGTASFSGSGTLDIRTEDGNILSLTFENCILATGSRPLFPPGIDIRSDRLWDSTAALELREIPRSLLVIGGGYIGLELGSVYAQLGSRVTLVEMFPGILPGADRDLVQTFLKRSGKRFVEILTESRVTGLEETEDGLRATIENQGGSVRKDFQYVLVSTGRRPNSNRIGLEQTAVRLDPRGFIQTGPDCGTGDPRIRAIGDVAGGAMLAHKASHEGRAAVDAIAGKAAVFAPRAIPAVVYADPEIAFTGLTESEAREKDLDVRVLKFPWAASGRAQAAANPDGLTKLIVDPGTGKILGVGIAGQNAGEMISEGSLAIGMGATTKDMASVIHPHPTLSETLMEAAELFEGTCTHIFRPKRS